MTTSDLQSRLDVVVVGHVDGAGRALVWRSRPLGKDGAAVKQAAVLPPGQRFTGEPGWLLRKLPGGKWLLLAGGTQHDDLVDSFGRKGIFHGAGLVGSAADIGIALAAPDATALCFEMAHLAVERRMAPSSQLRAAEAAAKKHGAIKSRLLGSRDETTPLPEAGWRGVQSVLRDKGLRPCTAPVTAGVAWGQPDVKVQKDARAMQVDGAEAAARRILQAWSD